MACTILERRRAGHSGPEVGVFARGPGLPDRGGARCLGAVEGVPVQAIDHNGPGNEGTVRDESERQLSECRFKLASPHHATSSISFS